MMGSLPLRGMRVVDASQGVAGPYCGLILAMHGADVLKVEPPEGDWLRHLGQKLADHSPHSWYLNRGKTSEVVDLRQTDGQERMKDLAAGSDVFISSMRPSVAQRMGLAPDALAARSPKVIQCIISGFGAQGPLANRGAVDGVLQAFAGWAHLNGGSDDQPRAFPYYAIDMVTGLYASQAVLAALLARNSTGKGQTLEISLMQSAAALLGPRLLEIAVADGERPGLFSSPNGSFRTSDGWFMVAVTTQHHFELVCLALECTDLIHDQRFSSRDGRVQYRSQLDKLLAEKFILLTTHECDRRFEKAGALGSPVNDLSQLLAHPQMFQTGGVMEFDMPGGSQPFVMIPGVDRILQARGAPPLALKSESNSGDKHGNQ